MRFKLNCGFLFFSGNLKVRIKVRVRVIVRVRYAWFLLAILGLYLQSMDSNGQSLDYPNLHFAHNICMSNPK